MDAISVLPYSPETFQHPYHSAHNRARVVMILLTASAAVSLAWVLASILLFLFPHLAFTDEETSDPVTILFVLLQFGLALMQIAVSLATIVAFLMWLYRSYENLPSFGVRKSSIKYSSGWAVGSFFVPFVLLVVPYRAIKELWNKSVPNSGDLFSDLGPPAFFPLWWATWLISNFANQIYLRLSWRGLLTPENDAAMGILTGFLNILAAVLALMVVKEIDTQQMASAQAMHCRLTDPHIPPPPILGTV